jgi:putative restriction endonuclease
MIDFTDKYLNEINKMNLNIYNGRPALKKPLLLLLIISKFEEGIINENKITFKSLEKELTRLIEQYGGRHSKGGARAYQPFQYMNSSKFWNLHLPPQVIMTHSHDLPISVMRHEDTFVSLDEELYRMLKTSRQVRFIISNFILEKWWPHTIQEELQIFLNLPSGIYIKNEVEKKKRLKDFSTLVLANFRNKCAFCGFSSTFNQIPFGLDGAHIKWFSQNGPNTIENGLALCKFHHWAFDRGVLSVSPNKLEILVSSKFVGQESQSIYLIEKLKGKEIFPFREVSPAKNYLEWHNDSIFLG